MIVTKLLESGGTGDEEAVVGLEEKVGDEYVLLPC